MAQAAGCASDLCTGPVPGLWPPANARCCVLGVAAAHWTISWRCSSRNGALGCFGPRPEKWCASHRRLMPACVVAGNITAWSAGHAMYSPSKPGAVRAANGHHSTACASSSSAPGSASQPAGTSGSQVACCSLVLVRITTSLPFAEVSPIAVTGNNNSPRCGGSTAKRSRVESAGAEGALEILLC